MNLRYFSTIVGLLGIILLFFLTLFDGISLFAGVGGVLGILFGVTFFFSPFVAFLILLFIRPLLDRVGEYFTFTTKEGISLELTAVFGIFPILFVALLPFLPMKKPPLFFRPLFPLTLSIFVFLGILAISIPNSVDPATSIREVIRVLSIFCVFFLGYLLVLGKNSGKKFHTLIVTILLSAVIPGIFGFFQYILGSGLEGTLSAESRIFGTFAHPNQFAGFLVIPFALAFLLFSQKKVTSQKNIYLAFMGIDLLLLVLTYARGALLALVLFLFFVSIKKSFRYFLAMLGILFLLFLFVPTFQNRIEEIYNPPIDSSISWRIEQWQRMYLLFLNKPLLGHGAGTEIIVHQNEYGESAGAPEAHNDFLKVAVENGLLGFLGYLSIQIAFLGLLFYGYQKNNSQKKRNLLFLSASLTLSLLLFSLGDNAWPSTALMWPLWASFGGILAYAGQGENFSQKQK